VSFGSSFLTPIKLKGPFGIPSKPMLALPKILPWLSLGAKIVTAFTDEDIRTIVNTGYFPTPGAKKYLIQILIHRRDKIGSFWFDIGKINPLDNFTFESDSPGKFEIFFNDLAIERGYADPQLTRYRYRIDSGSFREISQKKIPLLLHEKPNRIQIQTSRDSGKKWGKPLFLLLESKKGIFDLKKIRR